MRNKYVDETTKGAIEKFGAKGQIAVAMEELCELSSAVAKFIRYDDPKEAVEVTKDKVLDEVCDVILVLHTIANVYELTDEEVSRHLQAKASRVRRWVNSSGQTLETTTKNRAVQSCTKCVNMDTNMCNTCLASEAVEGYKPFYREG